jgi:hypothetical protein
MNSAFKKGLRPKLSEGVFYKDPEALEDAITEAIRLESNWAAVKKESKENKFKHMVNTTLNKSDSESSDDEATDSDMKFCAAMFKARANQKKDKKSNVIDCTVKPKKDSGPNPPKKEVDKKDNIPGTSTSQPKPIRQTNDNIIRGNDIICFNCNCIGHFTRDKVCCVYCKRAGHIIENCRKRISSKNLNTDSIVQTQ